jgi:hypothetical protein
MDVLDIQQKLPLDIRLYIFKLVGIERSPKQIICKLLKDDIISYSLKNNIISKYIRIYKQNYLYWLETDILFMINDNVPLMVGLQKDMLNLYENKDYDEICDILFNINDMTNTQRKKQISFYWRKMSPIKRYKLYDIYCNS